MVAAEIQVPARVPRAAPIVVNDVHSQLNATRVSDVVRPTSLWELATITRRATDRGTSLGVAGGRHAMGGQQFAARSTLGPR